MTRPGFRKGRPGGTRAPGPAESSEGFLSSALFSQAQILHLMKAEFARARRYGLPLGCLLLQVDRLPQLVDLYGVTLRDLVRQSVIKLAKDKTRGADLLGTTSEDRYLLVLPHTTLAQAMVVAERMLAMFRTLEFAVDGRELLLTMSLGVTACEDQQTMFFDSMLAQAEAALEYATQKGGDQVASFGHARILAPPSDAPAE